VQVLGQVLKALMALHGAGYAHCNIKPSNILQREKQHDWVLSDFACCRPQSALLGSSFLALDSCLGHTAFHEDEQLLFVYIHAIPVPLFSTR
jgi:serine/threonine protein kinase